MALEDSLHVLPVGHLGERGLQEEGCGHREASPLLSSVLEVIGASQTGYDPADGPAGEGELELCLAAVLDEGGYLLVHLVGADGRAALRGLATLLPSAEEALAKIAGVLELECRVHHVLPVP